ncbi:helix-turn-helix domain-containing protein [Saccharothrix xinjiangensis]|uniref:Helix-turn-helix domain-containing protein n=1 Tax=Saccharothrix xinjiangensis TaxID=204798 RepID=A0ABV9YAW8_9PSEU
MLLDTDDLAPGDRVEAVHTAFQEASAPCHVIHEHPDHPVRFRVELWRLGAVEVFGNRSSGMRLLRTERQAREDPAPVIAISVQRSGVGRAEQWGNRRLVPAGEMHLMDLSSSYDFGWSGEGSAGCVQVPLDVLGVPVDTIRRASGALRGSPLYRLVADHIAHLAGNTRPLAASAGAEPLGDATLDLVRALLASAAHDDRHVVEDTRLTQVRAYVRQHLAEPDLGPEKIAAAVNVSVRLLYKLCGQAGFSLEQWIIGERLEGARADLAADASPIAAIARRWGFADPTHFTRRFRAAFGCPPGEWRRSRLPGAGAPR